MSLLLAVKKLVFYLIINKDGRYSEEVKSRIVKPKGVFFKIFFPVNFFFGRMGKISLWAIIRALEGIVMKIVQYVSGI